MNTKSGRISELRTRLLPFLKGRVLPSPGGAVDARRRATMAGVLSSSTIVLPTDTWSTEYPYKRTISVLAPSVVALPAQHPVEVTLSYSVVEAGRMRSDFMDVEVVYVGATRQIVVPRTVERNGTDITIRFLLIDSISAGGSAAYYIYHGRPEVTQSFPGTFIDNEWPLKVPYTSEDISYTRPQEYWKSGFSEVVDAQANLEFYGPKVRVLALTSYAAGIIEIQLDGGEWEAIDLYSLSPPLTTMDISQADQVYSKTDLDTLGTDSSSNNSAQPEAHLLSIRCTGRKNLSSTSAMVNIAQIEYERPVPVSDLGEEFTYFNWVSI